MVMPDIVMCSLLVNRPVRTRMPGGVADKGRYRVISCMVKALPG
jgi:hypothetical protein